MAEVTLVLKADNSEYLRKMREAQSAAQKTYDTAEKGVRQEKGRIEELRNTIEKLRIARDKAYSIEKIEAYNKRIKEETEDLKELENAGTEAFDNTKKSSDKLGGSLASMATKLGLVTAAFALIAKVAKDVIASLKDTANGFKLTNEFAIKYKQTIYEIATGTTRSSEVIKRMIEMEKLSYDIFKKKNDLLQKTSDLQLKYENALFAAAGEELGHNARLKKLTEAMEIHNQIFKVNIAQLEEEYKYAHLDRINRPKNTTAINNEAAAFRALTEAKANDARETIGLNRQITAEQVRERKAMFQRYYDEIDAQNKANDEIIKRKEEFNKLSQQLVTEYEKAEIESLKGEEKLVAQSHYEMKALAMFREHIKKFGKLTPEQEQMFVELGENVNKKLEEGLYKVDASKILERVLGKAKLQPSNIKTTPDKPMDVWDMLGIYVTDDRKSEIEQSLKDITGMFVSSIESVYQARSEYARRTRELLDTQVSELEHELDREVELYKAGYAANVSLKQQQLDALKAAREKALRDEERALERERAIELAIQSVNLATSITSLFKDEIKSKGAYGLITGAIAAGAFLILWESYKSQAKSAARLAEGGSGTDTGMVTGKSHAAGGERFTDQIEVERGEAWGVLSVPATQKYGKIFHEMVSSFNRGDIPIVAPAATVNNRVMVENNGPNSRLDQLINENKKLNETLTNMESVRDIGKSRIIQRGNSIRVINR